MLLSRKSKKKQRIIHYRYSCRICKNPNLIKILDLGKLPLAGSFVKKKDKNKIEIKIQLDIHYCDKCKLIQVKNFVDPQYLFQKYNYSSSQIFSLNEHFKNYARTIKKFYKNKKTKLLEFGSNDGVLLKEFKKEKNFFCLGVEPSKNIFKIAKKKGLRVINNYFNVEVAKKIRKKFGTFDYITGSNVFAHIDDIHSVVEASKILLNKEGKLVVEIHYLDDLIKLNQYDFFYHEHLNYYTINSLKVLGELHGLILTNFEKISIHAGSIRVEFQFSNNGMSKKLKNILNSEKKINIDYLSKFKKNIFNQKKEIIKILKRLITYNKKIIGFGAPGRGTTFLNFCSINNNYLNYIVDSSPLRAGKLMPGIKVPIYHTDYLVKNHKEVDYILIIAWSYKDQIIKQVRKINKNIKFIIPFPKPKII
jgi:ubiquinone/menaquinone biosynthesis C-methylase UbiE